MSEWSRRLYGEPCRECGFSWSITTAGATDLVADLPAHLLAALAEAIGDERIPQLRWSVTAYVAHIGDNLRIWAERLAGISGGASPVVGSYDENLLAEARGYDSISLPAALWTLERATDDWLEVVRNAPTDLVMAHPDRGAIDLDEIVRSNAHDAAHHVWDIERSLQSAGAVSDG
jgi:hypothetical protein